MKKRQFAKLTATAVVISMAGCTAVEDLFYNSEPHIKKILITGGDERGDPIWVSVTIENTGRSDWEGEVIMTLGDTQIENAEVTVKGNSEAALQFEIQTNEHPPGTYDATISVDDEAETRTIEIPD